MTDKVQKIDLAEGFSVYASSGAEFETRFIYKEIFEDKCYDVATLPNDPFMIDAGGNIGMFSIYMKKKYPSAKMIAFEPAPRTFDTFKRNMELHHVSDVEVYQCGLGRDESTMTLTFYPNLPGNSTLYKEQKDDFINIIGPEHHVAKQLCESEQVQVKIQRLSTFLNKVPNLRRIHLLKIDVEGAELDVLHGLDEAHWGLIDNIVLEIADRNKDMAEAQSLLESKGFQVSSEMADWSKKVYAVYMMVAKRS